MPRLVGITHHLRFRQQGDGGKGVRTGTQPGHRCKCLALDPQEFVDYAIPGLTTMSAHKHRATAALTPLSAFEMRALYARDVIPVHVRKISHPTKTHHELLGPGGYVVAAGTFEFCQRGWPFISQVLLTTEEPGRQIDLQIIQ